MKELFDAEVAFDDAGRCIKHALAETRLPQEMIPDALLRLSAFQLAELVRNASSALWAIQESCDHMYKEHNNEFYCVKCGYRYRESETYRSCGCEKKTTPLF